MTTPEVLQGSTLCWTLRGETLRGGKGGGGAGAGGGEGEEGGALSKLEKEGSLSTQYHITTWLVVPTEDRAYLI